MSGGRCASAPNPTRKCSAVPEPVLGIAGRGVSKIYGTGAQAFAALRGVDFTILFMDEPFSALDAITRDALNIIMLETWQR
jgi:ABC-type sulfate/molybdate transport systems ATPase subunit